MVTEIKVELEVMLIAFNERLLEASFTADMALLGRTEDRKGSGETENR